MSGNFIIFKEVLEKFRRILRKFKKKKHKKIGRKFKLRFRDLYRNSSEGLQ